MKNIPLLPNEKVLEKIRFAKRIFLIDIVLLLATFSLAQQFQRYSLVSFLLIFLFFPLLIKALLDFYRINFHYVYITNERLIYQKGLIFKRLRIINLSEITEILIRTNFLDFNKILTTYKIIVFNNKPLVLKSILNGDRVGKLLSSKIMLQNNQSQ
ncbi:MAG: PH domain-containing protein [Bacilli bacterium]|nr:PH domain-containing protein [Bacilli bacterium]